MTSAGVDSDIEDERGDEEESGNRFCGVISDSTEKLVGPTVHNEKAL
jgi:hypothetical protein